MEQRTLICGRCQRKLHNYTSGQTFAHCQRALEGAYKPKENQTCSVRVDIRRRRCDSHSRLFHATAARKGRTTLPSRQTEEISHGADRVALGHKPTSKPLRSISGPLVAAAAVQQNERTRINQSSEWALLLSSPNSNMVVPLISASESVAKCMCCDRRTPSCSLSSSELAVGSRPRRASAAVDIWIHEFSEA